jgi:hypothetical protein
MSKSFNTKFVHDFEAIWSEKDPFGSMVQPSADGKPRGKSQFLHTHHGFVHVFSPYLVPFRGFVSTPKNKTATPNFFSALTF